MVVQAMPSPVLEDRDILVVEFQVEALALLDDLLLGVGAAGTPLAGAGLIQPCPSTRSRLPR